MTAMTLPLECKCIALDLDSTVIRLVGGKRGIFSIFTRRNVPHRLVVETYEGTKNGQGFSFDRLLKKLAHKTRQAFNVRELYREFSTWLVRSVRPYPDTLRVIRAWRAHKIPVVIVTMGDNRFQLDKAKLAKIPHDVFISVSDDRGKVNALRKLVAEYGGPVLFVDDKVSIHDAVRDAGLHPDQVITVIMRRPDSAYVRIRSRYRHREASTLLEVAKMV